MEDRQARAGSCPQTRATLGQHSAQYSPPKFTGFGQTRAQVGPNLANFGQVWSKLAEVSAKSGQLGQTRPESGQRHRAEAGRNWSRPHQSNSGQLRPTSGRCGKARTDRPWAHERDVSGLLNSALRNEGHSAFAQVGPSPSEIAKKVGRLRVAFGRNGKMWPKFGQSCVQISTEVVPSSGKFEQIRPKSDPIGPECDQHETGIGHSWPQRSVELGPNWPRPPKLVEGEVGQIQPD